MRQNPLFSYTEIDSPLGAMLAVASDNALVYLNFVQTNTASLVQTVSKRIQCVMVPQKNKILDQTAEELSAYFKGVLKTFKTPMLFIGTSFQKTVWDALTQIPYGKTCSYQEEAIALSKPSAYRAVANANGRNPLVIIVPCHRVIHQKGTLGGYSSGLFRKEWLLQHEQSKKIV